MTDTKEDEKILRILLKTQEPIKQRLEIVQRSYVRSARWAVCQSGLKFSPGIENYFEISDPITPLANSVIIRKLTVSCLFFNHPRSESWSLHGQVYAISICPLSPSVVFKRHLIAHVFMSSIHHIFGLLCFLAPGTVHCMISFSRHSPSFLIT